MPTPINNDGKPPYLLQTSDYLGDSIGYINANTVTFANVGVNINTQINNFGSTLQVRRDGSYLGTAAAWTSFSYINRSANTQLPTSIAQVTSPSDISTYGSGAVIVTNTAAHNLFNLSTNPDIAIIWMYLTNYQSWIAFNAIPYGLNTTKFVIQDGIYWGLNALSPRPTWYQDFAVGIGYINGPPIFNSSYNIYSVLKTGVGQYVVFNTNNESAPANNTLVLGNCTLTNGKSYPTVPQINTTTQSVWNNTGSAFSVLCYTLSGASSVLYDPAAVNLVVFNT